MTPGRIISRKILGGSFYNMERTVKEGDHVFVVIDNKRRFLIKTSPKEILGTDKGFIKHDDLIGMSIGSYVRTSRGAKAYILEPLLQDFVRGYKRATQIIYPKDAGFLIYLSGIGPSSIVVEAGVGTGCLTTALAHFVGPKGKVYGYDIDEEHLSIARENLEKSGYLDRVILKNKDIREGIDEKNIDAVFLDLPDPWNVIDHAYDALKPSRTLLIYVPTINQVEKTVLAIKEHGGFIDIKSYEILLREYIVEKGAVRPHTLMVGHTGYIIFSRKVLKV